MTQSPNPIHQPEASAETTLKLARRLLWIAFCWNDHNFDAAHIEARRTAEACGLKSFEQANEWLATQPPAAPAQVGTEDAEPVLWQSRFFDSRNPPGAWGEWEEVVQRNPYTDTLETKVQELRDCIAAGYKYEVRALYTAPQQPEVMPPAAPVAAVREAVPLTQEQANEVWRAWVAAGHVRCDWLSLLRLTEAAHGILPAASMDADPFLQTR